MSTSEELYKNGTEIKKKLKGLSSPKALKEKSPYDLIPGLDHIVTEWLYGGMWTRPHLDIKYRTIATLSVLIVLDRGRQLKEYIRIALNIGITKEQVTEIILHLMFYGGLPVCENALRVAKEAFDERPDIPYNPEPIVAANGNDERYKRAVEIRSQIYGKGGLRSVVRRSEEKSDNPHSRLTIGYLFGTIWTRPTLDLKSRLVCTLAALTVLGRLNQIPNAVRAALNLGFTPLQILEVFRHVTFYGGWDASVNTIARANDVFFGGEWAQTPPEVDFPSG